VRGENKNSPGWRVGLYFYSPILKSTRIWRVGEWLSAPLISPFHIYFKIDLSMGVDKFFKTLAKLASS
jgi:hypothetical protein